MKIKEMDESSRPRERAIIYGVESLTDNELLSIILRTGVKNKNVKELSSEILNTWNIKEFNDIRYNSLMKIKGLGSVKAITLMAVIELSKRINEPIIKTNILLNSSKKIYDTFKRLYKGIEQEKLLCLYLNNSKCLISYKFIFVGTINQIEVHPREILNEAIKVCASSIVIIHNHPSGILKPSDVDIKFTRNLKESCAIIGIPLIDHLIFSEEAYYSFFDNGLLYLDK